MHGILQFLDLFKLEAIIQLNRTWKSAIKSLKPPQDPSHFDNLNSILLRAPRPRHSSISWPLPDYRNSALLPHVFSVNFDRRDNLHISMQCELLRYFPNLRQIFEMRILTYVDNFPFQLPKMLRVLSGIKVSAWSLQSLIDACGELPHLTYLKIKVMDYGSYVTEQELQSQNPVDLQEDRADLFDFKPLFRSRQLTNLGFALKGVEPCHGLLHTNPTLESLVRALSDSRLRSFDLPNVYAMDLMKLIGDAPVRKTLQFTSWDESLNADEVTYLCKHFPSLQYLPAITSLHDCKALSMLPGLTYLHLVLKQSTPIVPFIATIGSLQYLSSLQLSHPLVTSEHLFDACSQLSSLRELHLDNCPSVSNLGFLSPLENLPCGSWIVKASHR